MRARCETDAGRNGLRTATVKCCQVLSSVVKCRQVPSSAVKCCQALSSAVKRCQVCMLQLRGDVEAQKAGASNEKERIRNRKEGFPARRKEFRNKKESREIIRDAGGILALATSTFRQSETNAGCMHESKHGHQTTTGCAQDAIHSEPLFCGTTVGSEDARGPSSVTNRRS
ncbi:uncharacterized protein M421DRAFT_211267 [Didymella exigua CBS 183.55]|uniref:Uncharacterized protein n=1 Tax=Didymella exigua CBS 183.55 TaxID=1150837 RepID=A0A6A5RHM9_9PLEO|nr:uncharacterized protein M421DRAFT_211267 [Didymella exigua CBS 183.55]KAF1926604.1 hypothetical protein M421DRAFT_211267 [Didymella exigua CBS 183.55]